MGTKGGEGVRGWGGKKCPTQTLTSDGSAQDWMGWSMQLRKFAVSKIKWTMTSTIRACKLASKFFWPWMNMHTQIKNLSIRDFFLAFHIFILLSFILRCPEMATKCFKSIYISKNSKAIEFRFRRQRYFGKGAYQLYVNFFAIQNLNSHSDVNAE